MQMFDSLFNAMYQSLLSLKNMYYRLPTYVDYPINDKVYYGSELMIPIGVNSKGIQYLMINQSNPHTYVCGTTGSGKSNLIKVILSSIINNYPAVQLILLDYKRVELANFKHTTNCIDFQWDSDMISQALEDLLTLVLQRYEVLESKGMTEADYTMSTIVVVIEEISLMSKQDMKILRKIAAISRAVHIYIILTTQRPDNTVLDNVLKSLVSNRICLKTEDSKNSVIALDEPGCELLKNRGQGYMKSNGYITEFQSYYISDEVVKDICSKHIGNHKELMVASNTGSHKGLITASDKIIVPPNEVLTPPEPLYVNDKVEDKIILSDEDWISKL